MAQSTPVSMPAKLISACRLLDYRPSKRDLPWCNVSRRRIRLYRLWRKRGPSSNRARKARLETLKLARIACDNKNQFSIRVVINMPSGTSHSWYILPYLTNLLKRSLPADNNIAVLPRHAADGHRSHMRSCRLRNASVLRVLAKLRRCDIVQ